MKIFHVTSPVVVPKDRDLYFAQPVTFETFKVAKKFSSSKINIHQACICYEEDELIIPKDFEILDSLTLSVKNYGDYSYKFPLTKEILDIAYKNSKNYQYIIFSNADISLMPYFYNTIYRYIELGYDSIVINRRSITKRNKNLDDIPFMFSEIGEKHVGWDCFVFKRELYKSFNLGNGVIGAVGSGRIIQSNLLFYSKNYIELKNSHLTFHLGMSPTSQRQYKELEWVKVNLHNNKECEKILEAMRKENGGIAVEWMNKRLTRLRIRTKRYNELLNPSDRFFGYWHIKKFLKLLNTKIF